MSMKTKFKNKNFKLTNFDDDDDKKIKNRDTNLLDSQSIEISKDKVFFVKEKY